jgi:hypothetical protein
MIIWPLGLMRNDILSVLRDALESQLTFWVSHALPVSGLGDGDDKGPGGKIRGLIRQIPKQNRSLKIKKNTSTVNRTPVSCLEGDYDNHYTTDVILW